MGSAPLTATPPVEVHIIRIGQGARRGTRGAADNRTGQGIGTQHSRAKRAGARPDTRA